MKEELGPSPTAEPEQVPESGRASRWVVGVAALVLAGVVIVIFYGYLARPGWIGVADKKFWHYLELLIVPAALALGVYWLNRTQQERERRAEEARKEREREAQAAQRERELEVENQRAQDVALQAYLDQMSQLLTDKDRPLHRAQLHDSLSTIARARTLAVLPRLDGERKRSILEFLYESDLIRRDRPILDLRNANLFRANLRWADLRRADLVGAYLVDANLSYADLREANLLGADLSYADLSGADLDYEPLDEARWLQAPSLEGATLPNGQKYEEWLKDREGSGEDGENGGPS
jgi:hypothetical protein